MAGGCTYCADAEAKSVLGVYQETGSLERAVQALAADRVTARRELVLREAAIVTSYEITETGLFHDRGSKSFQELISYLKPEDRRNLTSIERGFVKDPDVSSAIFLSPDHSPDGRSYLYVFQRDGKDPSKVTLTAIEHVGTEREFKAFAEGLLKLNGIDKGFEGSRALILSNSTLELAVAAEAAIASYESKERIEDVSDYLERISRVSHLLDPVSIEREIDSETKYILERVRGRSKDLTLEEALLEVALEGLREIAERLYEKDYGRPPIEEPAIVPLSPPYAAVMPREKPNIPAFDTSLKGWTPLGLGDIARWSLGEQLSTPPGNPLPPFDVAWQAISTETRMSSKAAHTTSPAPTGKKAYEPRLELHSQHRKQNEMLQEIRLSAKALTTKHINPGKNGGYYAFSQNSIEKNHPPHRKAAKPQKAQGRSQTQKNNRERNSRGKYVGRFIPIPALRGRQKGPFPSNRIKQNALRLIQRIKKGGALAIKEPLIRDALPPERQRKRAFPPPHINQRVKTDRGKERVSTSIKKYPKEPIAVRSIDMPDLRLARDPNGAVFKQQARALSNGTHTNGTPPSAALKANALLHPEHYVEASQNEDKGVNSKKENLSEMRLFTEDIQRVDVAHGEYDSTPVGETLLATPIVDREAIDPIGLERNLDISHKGPLRILFTGAITESETTGKEISTPPTIRKEEVEEERAVYRDGAKMEALSERRHNVHIPAFLSNDKVRSHKKALKREIKETPYTLSAQPNLLLTNHLRERILRHLRRKKRKTLDKTLLQRLIDFIEGQSIDIMPSQLEELLLELNKELEKEMEPLRVEDISEGIPFVKLPPEHKAL